MGNENPNQGVKKTEPGRSEQEKLTRGHDEKPNPRQGQGGGPSQATPGDKSKGKRLPGEESDDRDSE